MARASAILILLFMHLLLLFIDVYIHTYALNYNYMNQKLYFNYLYFDIYTCTKERFIPLYQVEEKLKTVTGRYYSTSKTEWLMNFKQYSSFLRMGGIVAFHSRGQQCQHFCAQLEALKCLCYSCFSISDRSLLFLLANLACQAGEESGTYLRSWIDMCLFQVNRKVLLCPQAWIDFCGLHCTVDLPSANKRICLYTWEPTSARWFSV